MKKKLILWLGICVFAINFSVFGQDQVLSDSLSNYVVIGAFSYRAHSKIWIQKAKSHQLEAVAAFNRSRKLYYVYVLRTDDRPKAIEEAEKIRKDTPFFDTWVYGGKFGKTPSGIDIDPTTGQTMNTLKGENPSMNSGDVINRTANTTANNTDSNVTGSGGSSNTNSTPGTNPSGKTNANSTNLVTSATSELKPTSSGGKETPNSDSIQAAIGSPVIDNTPVVAPAGAKVFLFKVVSSETQNLLVGKIDVIDLERDRKSGTYGGNRPVIVNAPNKSGNILIGCQVFTYRHISRKLNYYHPSDSGGVVIDTAMITVPFELQRLKKGDFAVMYNVYFFKDAAVMRPESKYEVNSLLDMMKENPKYKIRIHGHTNGNASGKVTSMGDSKNFYSLQGTHEGRGSAKKLSEERAKMMRQFLIENGIDERRMEVKAWGGSKPVYDKMSPQAQANVRVEIEILEDK